MNGEETNLSVKNLPVIRTLVPNTRNSMDLPLIFDVGQICWRLPENIRFDLGKKLTSNPFTI